jgi:hypothetical protein
VGDVAPITEAIWQPALIAGWVADVIGLLALTFSFVAARRAIDGMRAALNESDPPTYRLAPALNGIALWSFPVALLCLFSFVTANVVHAHDRRHQPSATTSVRRDEGYNAALARTEPRRPVRALGRSDPGTARAPGASTDPRCATPGRPAQGVIANPASATKAEKR